MKRIQGNSSATGLTPSALPLVPADKKGVKAGEVGQTDTWARDAGRLEAAFATQHTQAAEALEREAAALSQRAQQAHPRVDLGSAKVKWKQDGRSAHAGVGSGQLVSTLDVAQSLRAQGKPYVLVLSAISQANVEAALGASALVVPSARKDDLAAAIAGLGKPTVALHPKAFAKLAAGEQVTVDGTSGRVISGTHKAVTRPLDAAFTASVDALRQAHGAVVTAEATTPADIREARALGADKLRVDADAFLSTQPTLGHLRQYLLATEAAPRKALLEKVLVSVRTQAEALLAEAGSLPVNFTLGTRQPHSYFPVRPELLDQVAGELGLPAKLVRDRVGDLGSGNSKLGLRGARWGIKDPDLFAALGRGLMEAHAARAEDGGKPGPLGLLVPSVSLGAELSQVKTRLEKERKKVEADFGAPLPLRYGAGIETAAGALSAADISQHADFLEYGLAELTETLFGISRDDARTFLPQMVGQGIYPADPFRVVDMAGLDKMVLVGQGLAGPEANGFPASVRGETALGQDGLLLAKRAGIDEVVVSPSEVLQARLQHARTSTALNVVRGLQLSEPSLRDGQAKALDLLTRHAEVKDLGKFQPVTIPEGTTPLEFLAAKLRALKSGALDEAGFLLSVPTGIVDQLRRPTISPTAKLNELSRGIPASAGSGVGRVALSAEKAEEYEKAGVPYVVIVNEVHAEEVPSVRKAQALVSVRGGKTSHAAMIAANSDVPCVMNEKVAINLENGTVRIGKGSVKEGDWVTVDGTKGVIAAGQTELVDPSKTPEFAQLMGLANKHRRMQVLANADTPAEVISAFKRGADGVGLVRTEHMFFEPSRLAAFRAVILGDPARSAEELEALERMQYEDFKAMIDAAGDKKVGVRLLDPPLYEFLPHDPEGVAAMAKLLDLPAAEVAKRIDAAQEVDSLLGLRGVRLAVARPDIEAMQVRALARAYVDAAREGRSPAPLHVMIPMINTGEEMAQAKARVLKAVDEIAAKENLEIPVEMGAMIETPRAALDAAAIARSSDFFSYGTNDLTQLTLGYGRNVATKFIPELLNSGALEADPTGTLDRRTVGKMMQVARFLGTDTNPHLATGICGGQGADPESVRICESIGLSYLSVPPSSIAKAQLGAAQAHVLAAKGTVEAAAAGEPGYVAELQAAGRSARRLLDALGAPPWSAAMDPQKEQLAFLYRTLNRELGVLRNADDIKELRTLLPEFETRTRVREALDQDRMFSAMGAEITRVRNEYGAKLPPKAKASVESAEKSLNELTALAATQRGQKKSTASEGAVAAKGRDVLRSLDQALLALDTVYPLADRALRDRLRHKNDYWDNNHYTAEPPRKGEPMQSYIRRVADDFLKDNDLAVHTVGKENIPASGRVVFAASHRSGAIDRFVITSGLPLEGQSWLYQVRPGSPLDVRAKQAFGDKPSGLIAKDSLSETVEAVQSGFAKGARTLVTYPEGTGTLTGEPRFPAMGTLLIAEATGALVVPVQSADTFQVAPFGSGQVDVRIKRPIDLQRIKQALGPEAPREEVLRLAHALLEYDLGSGYASTI